MNVLRDQCSQNLAQALSVISRYHLRVVVALSLSKGRPFILRQAQDEREIEDEAKTNTLESCR